MAARLAFVDEILREASEEVDEIYAQYDIACVLICEEWPFLIPMLLGLGSRGDGNG